MLILRKIGLRGITLYIKLGELRQEIGLNKNIGIELNQK